jgi:hypothetical protein
LRLELGRIWNKKRECNVRGRTIVRVEQQRIRKPGLELQAQLILEGLRPFWVPECGQEEAFNSCWIHGMNLAKQSGPPERIKARTGGPKSTTKMTSRVIRRRGERRLTNAMGGGEGNNCGDSDDEVF